MVFPAYAGIDQTLNPAGLVKLIGEVSGNWIEAVCIGTGLDRETLDAETVDVLVQLTARVIEVNADFFGPRGVAWVRGGGRRPGDWRRCRAIYQRLGRPITRRGI